MSVRIIVDSTADVTADVKKRMTAVPLTIYFGEEEFIDGVTITHQEFYTRLPESQIMPTTSQPTPAAFGKVFKEAAAAGDEVVVVTISSKLSGTYQSAAIAAMDHDNVYVVDSMNAAIGTGILAEHALQLADSGMAAAEIAQILTEEREDICLVAVLDTLEYLKKGGRISSTVAFVGGMLSMKPMIGAKDGQIVMVGTARGSKQGIKALIGEVQKAGDIDFSRPFLLGYTGTSSAQLENFAAEASPLWDGKGEARQTQICSVVGVHAGPDAYAIAFFKKH